MLHKYVFDLQHCISSEKEMATHSSILAWKSPWTEEPGGLQSMGLHDWPCVHQGGGRCVGSNKLVELKKKSDRWREIIVLNSYYFIKIMILNMYAKIFHPHPFLKYFFIGKIRNCLILRVIIYLGIILIILWVFFT